MSRLAWTDPAPLNPSPPTLRRVRADGWRDRVSVKLLHGQCADTYAAHAQELANSFGAYSYRVRVDRPRRIWLDLLHADPLAAPIAVPSLAEPGTVVDLARVVIGCTETGRPVAAAPGRPAHPRRWRQSLLVNDVGWVGPG